MKSKNNISTEILKILLRQFSVNWTITALAKEINISRPGIWKLLKKLEKENLISLSKVGNGKTSAFIIKLNWENMILEKKLSLILIEDALKYQRWRSDFAELEKYLDFLILYGSILYEPKKANDIDILGITSTSKFKKIDMIIQNLQKIQLKKIHSENLTKYELKTELKKPNKIFIDAIKKGVILFGQEKFITFVRGLYE